MSTKRGLKQRLQEAVRKREGKPRPQVVPTGDVRSDRWDEITTHHTDLLLNIEGIILETWQYVTGLCDHWTHLGLIGAMRNDMPDHPCSLMLFEALKKLRQQRDDVDDELWLDALRVVDQSVRDHSSLRHGDRSYLTFISAFFGNGYDEDRSNYRVAHERIQRPIMGALPTGDVVIGFAWYRREQWPLLCSLAPDHDELEETYDQWLAVANKAFEDLRCQGVRAEKVDIDVQELSAWCKKHGRPLDADARAAFASQKMGDSG
jgi:hypothetical protein